MRGDAGSASDYVCLWLGCCGDGDGGEVAVSDEGMEAVRAVLATAGWGEIVAPVVFLAVWVGYSLLSDHFGFGKRSLMRRMNEYRRAWLVRMLVRDNRVVDVQVVQVLAQSVSFFASSSILIIGGFVAMLGAAEEARGIAAAIPFAEPSSPMVWNLKIVLLMVIFVYAFFKFTWSLRQFNHVVILIGAAPTDHEPASIELAYKIAIVASRASNHFNRAMRAYYFGLAALSWLVQSWLFVLVSLFVVVIVYRREHRSTVLGVLGSPGDPIAGLGDGK